MTPNHRAPSVPRVLPVLACAFLLAHWIPLELRACQDSAGQPLPPGVKAEIQAQPLQALIGDPIQVDLEVTFPRGYRIDTPAFPQQLGEFTVLESYPGPETPLVQAPGSGSPSDPSSGKRQDPDFEHHRARLVVAAYRTGEFDFPSLSFILRNTGGGEVTVSTPEVHIRIESILAEGDTALRDLKGQVAIEDPVRWIRWFAAGAALILLSAFLWLRQRRRRGRLPQAAHAFEQDLDPLDLAEANLRDLVGRGLPEKGLTKQFYVSLSEILKAALEAGYRVPTVEKTTSEIITSLALAQAAGGGVSSQQGLEPIETLLLSCDMVKFARYRPSPGENQEAAHEAFSIIASCRAQRQALEPKAVPAAGVS